MGATVREGLGQAVDAQGVLNRPEQFRGCELTIVSPPCYVGDRASGNNVERLMRCPEAARLKRTASKRVYSPDTSPNLRLKRPRSDPAS